MLGYMTAFAPISWTDSYPTGLINIGDDGVIENPKRTLQQTVDNVALKRGLELLSTGSTNNLTPLRFVRPPIPNAIVVQESFQNNAVSLDIQLFFATFVLLFLFYLVS